MVIQEDREPDAPQILDIVVVSGGKLDMFIFELLDDGIHAVGLETLDALGCHGFGKGVEFKRL